MSKKGPDGSSQMQRVSESMADLLGRGVEFHRNGNLQQAEESYRRCLARDPKNVVALNLLGFLFIQTKRSRDGLDLLDQALALKPDYLEAVYNRGIALGELKRLDEALAAFDAALVLQPNHAAALANRGLTLQILDRLDEALASYDKALAIAPDDADALANRGAALLELQRPGEALPSLDRALAIKPGHVAAIYNRGKALGRLKRFDEALGAFEEALAIRPGYVEAVNNRGLALMELSRFEEALAAFDAALTMRPGYAVAINNRGLALSELNRSDEALAAYDAALAINPDYVEAIYNRGNALAASKRFEEALAAFDLALAIKPDYCAAYNNRGLTLQQLNRFAAALASYDAALAIDPRDPAALTNRGAALIELNRSGEALASLDQALAIAPRDPAAAYNRGKALGELRRFDEALACFDDALAIRPGYVEALNNRGLALTELNQLDEALAALDQALSIRPDYVEAINNRGMTLQGLNRLDEALAAYDAALAIKPDYAKAFNNRGLALQASKRLEEALASYDAALAIDPDYADAIYNRALLFLLKGDLAAGWPGYESRWEYKYAPKRKLDAPFPNWSGEDLSGKSIVVYEEQGLGDNIQFVRYLKLLVAAGAQVTFVSRRSLLGLMRSFDEEVRTLTVLPEGERFDYQSALLSLPLGFGTQLQDVPAPIPYLRAEPERVEKWCARLGAQGFKVGVAWQGNPLAALDAGRSFALAEFFGLSKLPGVRLISLQKNDGVEQLAALPPGMAVETLGEDYDAGGDALLDAAAVMENLDLVISSDTSIAHLAGALGRPVWVALKHVPEWRWLLDRADSPWYPTMRLFRQANRGDWKGVFSDMEAALRARLEVAARPIEESASTTPQAPVSWGELIDKITILEIKSVEISNEAALRNVNKELLLLRQIAGAQLCEEISSLKSRLKEVNGALWRIEDAIREKERKGEFDGAFIELARSVYKRNDERASIKRRINDVLKSGIVEEKSYAPEAGARRERLTD